MTHTGTQTLCVTQMVTHRCPPALLTQLYTSEMCLGLTTAGEKGWPCPAQTMRGASVCMCVWEDGVDATAGGSEVSLNTKKHTLTFRSFTYGAKISVWICSFWTLVAWKLAFNLVSVRLPRNPDTVPLSATSWRPQGPSGLLSPCFHTWKCRQEHLGLAIHKASQCNRSF